MQVKVKAGAEDVLTQQAVLTSLIDSDLQTSHGDGVLGTDVHVTLSSADGVTGDGHSLHQTVGVTLQNGTIHKRTGVALVGVTDNVLLGSLVGGGQRPLTAGGEATAATATQTGIQNGLDNVLGGHLGQHLTQSGVTVHGDVLVDRLGVDDAAVTQNHAVLSLVEGGVGQGHVAVNLLSAILVDQTLHHATLQQVLGDDLGHVVGLHTAVEGAVGMDDNHGTQCAQTEATGLHNLDFFFQTIGLNVLIKGVNDLVTARGGTAGTAADQNMSSNHN